MYCFPLPVVWVCTGYPFHQHQDQHYRRAASSGHAGCLPFHRQQYWTCRVYPFPQLAMKAQGLSLSFNISIDVQGVSLCTANRMDLQGVFLSTVRNVDLQCAGYVFPLPAVWTCRMCAFLLSVVWTCRLYPFFKWRNVGLSSIQSVRYRNEQNC